MIHDHFPNTELGDASLRLREYHGYAYAGHAQDDGRIVCSAFDELLAALDRAGVRVLYGDFVLRSGAHSRFIVDRRPSSTRGTPGQSG